MLVGCSATSRILNVHAIHDTKYQQLQLHNLQTNHTHIQKVYKRIGIKTRRLYQEARVQKTRGLLAILA
jgi:hypothetical protein